MSVFTKALKKLVEAQKQSMEMRQDSRLSAQEKAAIDFEVLCPMDQLKKFKLLAKPYQCEGLRLAREVLKQLQGATNTGENGKALKALRDDKGEEFFKNACLSHLQPLLYDLQQNQNKSSQPAVCGSLD